ncbi:hypothetical protein AVEN_135679-1 [Araneus ventricosus]|uniref:Integrase catalytic domain-containing protein n=1 Tax=Araneus ventricosus TaxID=182803 RepID=A0A4Y2K011_ARAVE|nr:hypothetical protein AVEN_229892-1 [Araneus ventricosus]GBM95670.1 hypothetical protein AVEN_11773-1 [Araneus ventricosus]GBM95692.1 hypothetical protein AVEN_135679-1 [Araneus ventricosus]
MNNFEKGLHGILQTVHPLPKVSRHVKSPKGDFSLPPARFSHIHLDVVGPLPPSKDYRYCLTAVDRFTRWPEVFPMIDQTANTIAETFYSGWISRFGAPEVVTTDQGRNFESDLFHSFTKYLAQIFVYKELVNCSHVFVRRDAVRRPLQQPYDGLFQVLQRKAKDYKMQVKDKPIWISINRLKPVFGFKEHGASVSTRKSSASIPANKPSGSIPANEPSASSTASASLPASSSTYTTKFGRKVRFLQPVKYRPSDSGRTTVA